MTREDEIYKAANKFSKEIITPFPATINMGFIKGAMWADEHPIQVKEEMLDKVCKWLEEHSWEYVIGDNFKDAKMISDLKKAMKEE